MGDLLRRSAWVPNGAIGQQTDMNTKKPKAELLEEPQCLLARIREQDAALYAEFSDKIEINSDLNRRIVSFQGNKSANGHRWCSYREGFSDELIRYAIQKTNVRCGRILDPFAGSGTALFAANAFGLDAVGIELLPNSVEMIEIHRLTRLADTRKLPEALRKFRDGCVWEKPGPTCKLRYLRITESAYPPQTERHLERFVYEAREVGDPTQARLLLFAAMCVLENISYTRKDGQYLRWDHRSGRSVGRKKRFEKHDIASFSCAIRAKLTEIADDIEIGSNGPVDAKVGQGLTTLLPGSCLHLLPRLQSSSFDGIVTSPPYCNRYDYTRTYALELAFLGVSEPGIRELRQAMLCCTVENREKNEASDLFDTAVWQQGSRAFANQTLLQLIISYLELCRRSRILNNTGIARMVRNYFLEMAIVIADCHRVLRPGAPVVMVNDNVQYQGVSIPVDLILSDIARKIGFTIEKIWVLPRGKGNSSQQMERHGRQETRKCVYVWRRAFRGTNLQCHVEENLASRLFPTGTPAN